MSGDDGKYRNNGNYGENGENEAFASHNPHTSHNSPQPNRLLPPRGDYQTLLSYH